MDDFLERIISCNEEEINDIIKEKIYLMEESDSSETKIIIPNEHLYDYGSYYKGFIKYDVKIFPSTDDCSGKVTYMLANYNYIFEFFKSIKKFNINKKINAIFYLSTFLDEYFGNPDTVNPDDRERFLMELNGQATIENLRGKGLAACSERAAVANNLMEMLGLNSIYVTGEVNGEQHAFNIVIKDNKYFIVDTTNRCGLYDEYNNIIGTVTYYHNLGEINESINLFLTTGERHLYPQKIARKKDEKIVLVNNGEKKSYCIEPIKMDEEKQKHFK